MSTFQKAALLIMALILVALLALVAVLLTRPTASDILAINNSTQTAVAIEGATSASIEFGNSLASATAVFATQTEVAREALFATATWVVEQNAIVETRLVVSVTAQQERINATATANAGG